jgi:hypothetical protein
MTIGIALGTSAIDHRLSTGQPSHSWNQVKAFPQAYEGTVVSSAESQHNVALLGCFLGMHHVERRNHIQA